MSTYTKSWKKLYLIKRFIRRYNTTRDDSCVRKPVLMTPNCKNALVTGGCEGIGFSVAHQLLCNKANHVALLGLDSKVGIEVVETLNCAHGKNKAIFVKCNVSNKCEVEDAFKKIKQEFDNVDIIVNAAGIWNAKEWEKELATNLNGTILTNLLAKTCMTKGGVIVNVVGIQGIMPFPASPTVSASFSGVIALTRAIGNEVIFNKSGVRCVALCTGNTDTKSLENVEERTLNPDMKLELVKYLKKAPRQKTDPCGKSAIHLIKYGPSGTVWVVEGSRLFALDIPDWKSYSMLVSQFI